MTIDGYLDRLLGRCRRAAHAVRDRGADDRAIAHGNFLEAILRDLDAAARSHNPEAEAARRIAEGIRTNGCDDFDKFVRIINAERPDGGQDDPEDFGPQAQAK